MVIETKLDLTKIEGYFRQNPIDGVEFKGVEADKILPNEKDETLSGSFMWMLRLIFRISLYRDKLVLRFECSPDCLEYFSIIHIMARHQIEDLLSERRKGKFV